ncbi:LIM domain-containing protein [Chloroflexota bacterium]
MKPTPSQQAAGQKIFCQLCGQNIIGQGESFHHPKWARELNLRICSECFQNKPRCRVCNLPMAAAPANGVCATCSQYNQFCQACGKPIKRNYVEVEGVGRYCEKCYRQRTPCDVCGAPLTDQHWKLSDGRVSCAFCHATAIYAPAEGAVLYDEMKTSVAELFGLSLNVPTGLALVDRNQLAEVISQQQKNMSDDAHNNILDPNMTLGLYARRGMRRGIYVQTGLPRMLFLQVAAHEFAHAWQGENCPLLRELLVHEGFAEWVAYRVLGRYGYTHGQARMKARQDIYGQGLRWALEIETKQGPAGLLEACRQVK